MMNDLDFFENLPQTFPFSFKVIGIGSESTGIIEMVKSFDYDCVGCLVANNPADCIPTDEDKMAIIVTKDDVDAANKIAKTYHDTGVLTIGLVPDADYSCYYDSIATETRTVDFLETIKSLLLPVVADRGIHTDYHDLCTILKNSHSFSTFQQRERS